MSDVYVQNKGGSRVFFFFSIVITKKIINILFYLRLC